MTSKQFIQANYQVTKILGSGADIYSVILREEELADEIAKENKDAIYYIFEDYQMIEKGINGKKLKTFINQLSA